VYGSGGSSASGSALSLSLPGIGLGRRRGNSGGSNLAREITPETAEPTVSKGKEVDRNVSDAPSHSAPIDVAKPSKFSGVPGARHLDTTILANIHESQQSASPTAPERPSHLRHMSNVSSPASSFIESVPGSLRNDFHGHGSSSSLDTPNASGSNVAGHENGTPDEGDSSGNAGNESMFNFRSLAEIVGRDEKDKEDAAKHVEYLAEHIESGPLQKDSEEGSTSILGESIATLKIENLPSGIESSSGPELERQTTILGSQQTTPEVKITPVTPAAVNHGDHDGKQLGAGWTQEVAREVTQ